MPVKLDDRNPLTKADWLVTLVNVPGYFSKFSGVKKTFTRASYSDGLTTIKRTAMSGAIEYENITISKAFDPDKDNGLIEWLKEHECGDPFDVSAVPVKRCNGIEKRGNKGWSLSGCKLIDYSIGADTDTMDGGSSVSELVIVFSLEGAEWSGSATGAIGN